MHRGFGLPCVARLSGGRGYCRAWALQGKRRCKFHGGRATGPRTAEGMARTLAAMARGRERKAAGLRVRGLKLPGGRPGRISARLRAAIVATVDAELPKLDAGSVQRASPVDDCGEQAQQLADLERDGLHLAC